MRTRFDARTIAMPAAAALGALGARTLRERSRARHALRRTVGELMTREVTCVDQRESVSSTAERLAEEGVGAVPICDTQRRLVGMLTDRDIVLRLVAQSIDPQRLSAGDCAQREPASLLETDPVAVALARMSARRVRRLPVLRDGRVVGLLSHADLTSHTPAPALAALNRALLRSAPDQQTAGWLFTQPYRERRRPSREESLALRGTVRELLHERETAVSSR